MKQQNYPYPFLSVRAIDGTIAQVNRHKDNLYSLSIVSRPSARNRWGSLLEIKADIEIFIATGYLPIPISPRW